MAPLTPRTPPQAFNLVLDFATSSVVVFSTASCSNNNCNGLNVYDPSKSSTWRAGKDVIPFKSGSLSTGSDIVVVGGQGANFDFEQFPAINIAQGVIETSLNASGVVGLGAATAPPGNFSLPLLYYLSKGWTDKSFGLYMARTRKTVNDTLLSAAKGPGGSLTLGVIASKINYVPLLNLNSPAPVWAVPLDGLLVQGKALRSVEGEASPLAVPNAGSLFILAPPSWVDEFYSHIEHSFKISYPSGSYSWVFPALAINISNANAPANNPASTLFQLVLGGQSYPMADADFVYQTLSAWDLVNRFKAQRSQAAPSPLWVFGTLQPIPDNVQPAAGHTPAIYLGSSFLKNVYSSYRFTGPDGPAAVGFARLKPEAGAPVAPVTYSYTRPAGTGTSSAKPTASSTKGGDARANRVAARFVLCAAAVAALL
ncbi:uncharacterized protein LOC62_02G003328 [Vanrija pseudolonga]|uniref:Peptidase A1 domain-containing protein n=1 Tax=Vanrija pseudolonga TaxID=143232 RepID=A0AAF1BH65_9TREE|nr:hypothetical protein LOC62_02G003328 [Vanrija pseudolonga]